MVDSSCVVIGLFSQVHLLSFPFFSAILWLSFSVIFSYQCARCLSSLYYSLNLPFIRSAGSSNEWFSVFLVLSARLFSSSRAPFGCWSLAGNSILSPLRSPFCSHLLTVRRRTAEIRPSKGKGATKKAPKNKKKFRKWNKKLTKLVTDVFPFFVRLWSLNCFLLILHVSFLFSLALSTLKKNTANTSEDPTSENNPILKSEWNLLK